MPASTEVPIYPAKPRPRKARTATPAKEEIEAADQVVFVRWHDSYGAFGGAWESRSADLLLNRPEPIGTVGFLVGIDDQWAVIAQSIGDSQVGHALRIPRACIVSLTVLNVVVEVPAAA